MISRDEKARKAMTLQDNCLFCNSPKDAELCVKLCDACENSEFDIPTQPYWCEHCGIPNHSSEWSAGMCELATNKGNTD